MKAEDMEGWGAADTPNDGYQSEGEINIPKLIAAQNRKKLKSGGFMAMGLSQPVLKGILKKGYKDPTPIQRKTIPLILEGKDVVAMARTGSGKTAAFLVPLFEKLRIHSAKVGARALVLSPTRELSLQTLAFAKEIGKFTGLRAASILGGESIENQFAALHDNPDIILATPGRFMHVCVEMNLKLDTVEYIVFDEADRLFEMGFQEQLNDIICRLSSLRQTLLFSATLPKMLVDFARAGLSDPTLIRLDVDTKISENLKLNFFKVNTEEKLPLLIHILKNVVDLSGPTVVFTPTKHHVEYLHDMLNGVGLESTYVFSSLDPAARKINIAKFRLKKVKILIVTDVAARGIDIPLLDNVINFNFPSKAKLFVHRVGRVARAGRRGTAYSFVAPDEVPYLLELHMFLSRSIRLCMKEEKGGGEEEDQDEETWDRMFGRVPQDIIDDNVDYVRNRLENSYDLRTLRKSAGNALMKYTETRPAPSSESIRRMKEELWGKELGYHPIFNCVYAPTLEQERIKLLDVLKNVRPKTTIFEVKKEKSKSSSGGSISAAMLMKEKRKLDGEKIQNYHNKINMRKMTVLNKNKEQLEIEQTRSQAEESSEVALMTTFQTVIGKRKREKNDYGGCNSKPIGDRKTSKAGAEGWVAPVDKALASQEDAYKNHFIPYNSLDKTAEEGYSVMSNFEKETSTATMDLMGDDQNLIKQSKVRMKWDRKQMKFKGQDHEKKVKTESGAWVNASYKKDLYQKWKLKMQPHQAEGGEEGDMEGIESGSNWRSKRREEENKPDTAFISLSDPKSGNLSRNRAHPLVKGKRGERVVHHKTGPLQVRTHEQKMKLLKDRAKKKKREMDRENQNRKKYSKSRGGGKGFNRY